jgi:hypothetical protein
VFNRFHDLAGSHRIPHQSKNQRANGIELMPLVGYGIYEEGLIFYDPVRNITLMDEVVVLHCNTRTRLTIERLQAVRLKPNQLFFAPTTSCFESSKRSFSRSLLRLVFRTFSFAPWVITPFVRMRFFRNQLINSALAISCFASNRRFFSEP